MPFKVYSAGRVQQLWLLLQLVSYWLVGCHGGQCLAVVYYLWTEQWTENIGRCGFYICACHAGARKSDFQQKKEIKFLHLAHFGFVEACQLLFTKNCGTQLFCGAPDASMLCLPFTSFYEMRFRLSFRVFLSIWCRWLFQPQIRPQMEPVQKRGREEIW